MSNFVEKSLIFFIGALFALSIVGPFFLSAAVIDYCAMGLFSAFLGTCVINSALSILTPMFRSSHSTLYSNNTGYNRYLTTINRQRSAYSSYFSTQTPISRPSHSTLSTLGSRPRQTINRQRNTYSNYFSTQTSILQPSHNTPPKKEASPSLKERYEQALKKYSEKTQQEIEDIAKEKNFLCCIYFDLMNEPARLTESSAGEGANYMEYSALCDWFKNNPINPCSRKPMTKEEIQIDTEQQQKIKDFVEQIEAEQLTLEQSTQSLHV